MGILTMETEALKKIIKENEIIFKKIGSNFQIELVEQKVNQIYKITNSKEIFAKVSRRGWSKYEWESLTFLYNNGYYVPKPIHYIPLETPILKDWNFGDLIQENGIIFYYPISGKNLLKNYSEDNLLSVLQLLHNFHRENIESSTTIKDYRKSEVSRGLKYIEELNLTQNDKLIQTIKNYSNLDIDYGLIHGDARPEHFIFNDNKIGMIDLEGTCIGDPFKDFGILLGELYFYGYNLNLEDYSIIEKLFKRKLSDIEILRLNFFLIRRILVKLKYGKISIEKNEIMKTLKGLCKHGYTIIDKKKEKVLVLDSSAFLGGFNPNIITIQQMTIPEILDEVKNQSIKSLIEIAAEHRKLQFRSPSGEFVKEIKKGSKKSGDNLVLSDVDIKILALALEAQRIMNLNPTLVTDDYAMQNIAGIFNLKFKSVIEKGIKNIIKWKIYCPGCKKSFNKIPNDKMCPDCGTKIKRFPFNKSS